MAACLVPLFICPGCALLFLILVETQLLNNKTYTTITRIDMIQLFLYFIVHSNSRAIRLEQRSQDMDVKLLE
jgi:hypothetical protein